MARWRLGRPMTTAETAPIDRRSWRADHAARIEHQAAGRGRALALCQRKQTAPRDHSGQGNPVQNADKHSIWRLATRSGLGFGSAVEAGAATICARVVSDYQLTQEGPRPRSANARGRRGRFRAPEDPPGG